MTLVMTVICFVIIFYSLVTVTIFVYIFAMFQFDLPLDEFEGKLNKSKLKLVLTNGKIQG